MLPTSEPFVRPADPPPRRGGAVRTIRRCLVDEQGALKPGIDFAGYWRHRLTRDDAPTAGGLADAQEWLAASS
ncbi:hypothetical protein ACWC9T_19205 [Kitasatospora sp. NPDC001159]